MIIKFIRILVALLICTLVIESNEVAIANEVVGRITEELLKATVRIETPTGGLGTGFIISKPSRYDRSYFFLVTTKHLIGDYSCAEGRIKDYYDFITISVYKKNGSVQKVNIPLKDKKQKIIDRKIYPYPKPYIDIALISIAEELEGVTDIDKWSISLSYLATSETLKKWHIDMGDQVFALGYPYNIYSKINNYPIAKLGCISSKVGEEIIVTVNYKDQNGMSTKHDLKGKLILLDGTLVPGNSGGPIIVPRGRREITQKDRGGVLLSNKSIPNFIIGIQSQSNLDAGVSFAFSSEYVLELIDHMVE